MCIKPGILTPDGINKVWWCTPITQALAVEAGGLGVEGYREPDATLKEGPAAVTTPLPGDQLVLYWQHSTM